MNPITITKSDDVLDVKHKLMAANPRLAFDEAGVQAIALIHARNDALHGSGQEREPIRATESAGKGVKVLASDSVIDIKEKLQAADPSLSLEDAGRQALSLIRSRDSAIEASRPVRSFEEVSLILKEQAFVQQKKEEKRALRDGIEVDADYDTVIDVKDRLMAKNPLMHYAEAGQKALALLNAARAAR